MTFKVISSAEAVGLEIALNKLEERYKNVDVQQALYCQDGCSTKYVAIVKIKDELLPNTYYTPVKNEKG